MTQEIWKMSILYSKTSEEFCPYIKCLKSIMNRVCSIRLATLTRRDSNAGSSVWILQALILKKICERLRLKVFPFMLVWRFSYMNIQHKKLQSKWRRRFLKNKTTTTTTTNSWMEKTDLFMMLFINASLFCYYYLFANSRVNITAEVKRHLSVVIGSTEHR